jgi:hypothetical protein
MPVMNCPVCSAIVPLGLLAAKCLNCGWDSTQVHIPIDVDVDLEDLVSDPEALRAEIRAGVQEGFADVLGPRVEVKCVCGVNFTVASSHPALPDGPFACLACSGEALVKARTRTR